MMGRMAEQVLVTGISGFVGGALARRLRGRTGAHVTGVSRTPPREGTCEEFFAHDLAKPLPAQIAPFDVIVHCAALASPWARPAEYERNNIRTLMTVLELAKRTRP